MTSLIAKSGPIGLVAAPTVGLGSALTIGFVASYLTNVATATSTGLRIQPLASGVGFRLQSRPVIISNSDCLLGCRCPNSSKVAGHPLPQLKPRRTPEKSRY